MARNDTRRFRPQPADRAPLRADAASWRALANVTVASTLVVIGRRQRAGAGRGRVLEPCATTGA